MPNNRHLAPFNQEVWQELDEEARDVLQSNLNARQVLDVLGPRGSETAAANTGRVIRIHERDEVHYSLRSVLPLIEIETLFQIDREEIRALQRGASDPDLDPLIKTCNRVAHAENDIVFSGFEQANIQGILEESPHSYLDWSTDDPTILSDVVDGVNTLNDSGVEGPYSLLLGPSLYKIFSKYDDGGYQLQNELERILDGEVTLAPSLDDEGVLLSQRGGDFELILGTDLSLDYEHHDRESVQFRLYGSFTFRLNTPEASIPLE